MTETTPDELSIMKKEPLLNADKKQLLERMNNLFEEIRHFGLSDVNLHLGAAITKLRLKSPEKS